MKLPQICGLIMMASLILSGAIDTVAQTPQKPGSSVGKFFFVGPNIGFLRGTYFYKDSERYQQPKIGFTIGIGNNFQLSEHFDFSSMIMMEEKGTILHLSYNGGQDNAKEEITYRNFTLSLLPVYRFGMNRKFGIAIGSFLSYLHKQTVDGLYYPPPQRIQSDQTNHNLDWEFGLSFQVDYQIKLNKRLSLDLRLLNQLGLTNTRNIKKYLVFGVVKTNATSFLLGFSYQLMK